MSRTPNEQHFIYMVKLLKEHMDLNNTPPK